MRVVYVLSASALCLMAAAGALAQSAPKPAQTADEIVCKLTDDCGQTPANESAKIDTGKEAGLSFVKRSPSSRPEAAAVAPASRAVTAVGGRSPRATAYTVQSSRRGPAGGRLSFAPGLDMRINFATGSAQMDRASQVNADEFAKALMSPKLAGRNFVIEGHTDAVGSRDSNMKLSLDRANAVTQYLTGQGVPASRMTAKGYGFDKPLPGRSKFAAGNRRVQIVPTS